MSIFDKVKEAALNQFIEVIQWLDNTGDTMVYRFPVVGQEIKNGAQLIVRESQGRSSSFSKARSLTFSHPGNTRSTAEHSDPVETRSLEIRF